MATVRSLPSAGYRAVLGLYERWLRATVRPRPGTTVVIVNFNARDLLETTLSAIDRFAPGTSVLVVDNNSRDGSRRWIPSSGRRHLLLRSNIGHGPALDLGVLRAGTEYVITLDVDAFPISAGFLPALLGPLQSSATVAGASSYPGRSEPVFVHPCCLAMRLDRFIERRHSFRSDGPYDVGERITYRETRPHLIDATSTRGPGAVGTVFGGIVYHNYYGTRFTGSTRDRIDWVNRDDPRRAWDEAVTTYLG